MRIEIPYNDAGQFAFDTIHDIAVERWETGRREAEAFILATYPNAEATAERIEDGNFYLTAQTPSGKRITAAYDYQAKGTKIVRTEDNRRAKSINNGSRCNIAYPAFVPRAQQISDCRARV